MGGAERGQTVCPRLRTNLFLFHVLYFSNYNAIHRAARHRPAALNVG